MSDRPLRIAMLGGVPASLGGGGLEVQMQRTRAALERAGHAVFHAAESREPRPFDVLHAFGSEREVWHALDHWRRNPAPLVVSSVMVVAPGWREWSLLASHRLPLPAFAPRARVDILRRADAVIALTEHERRLARRLTGARRAPRVEVIGNGVDPVDPADPRALAELDLPVRYVVLLGAVSPRKRQAEIVDALAGGPVVPVVIGGVQGGEPARRVWEVHADRAGARWLGEIDDATLVRAVLAGARGLVHLSGAEGQSLAVLEGLAAGAPAVLSQLPSHRELAERYPGHVVLVDGLRALPAAVARAAELQPGPAPVPTWDEVAARLVEVYREVAVSP